jgi:hypothetical protein
MHGHHRNAKPDLRTNLAELFRAMHSSLFKELEATADKDRRKEIKRELRRLARKSGVALGRHFGG